MDDDRRIVIFDMDGTLVDSGRDITTSVNYVRQEVYGLAPLSVAFVVEAINRDQRNLALLFYGVEEYEPAAREAFERHYHEQCVRTPRLYEGVGEMLEHLREMGCMLAVATNAPGRFAARMLSHLGVIDHFGMVVGSEHVPRSKPDPAMLRLILERYRYRPGRDLALMVGDNSKDMEAAARAAIPGIFVTWGFSPEGSGDFVCTRPGELGELLQSRDNLAGWLETIEILADPEIRLQLRKSAEDVKAGRLVDFDENF